MISIKIKTNKTTGYKLRINNNIEECNKSFDYTYKSLEREKNLNIEKLTTDKKLSVKEKFGELNDLK